MTEGSSFGLVDVDGIDGSGLMSLGLTSAWPPAIRRFRRYPAVVKVPAHPHGLRWRRGHVYRSPTVLTPFRGDGLIDTQALDSDVHGYLTEAGIQAAPVQVTCVLGARPARSGVSGCGTADVRSTRRARENGTSSLKGHLE